MRERRELRVVVWTFALMALFTGLFLCARDANAGARQGDRAIGVFRDFGDTVTPFSVLIGSASAVQFYTPTRQDRWMVLCSTNTANFYVSTFSVAVANLLTAPRIQGPTAGCSDQFPVGTALYGTFVAGTSSSTLTGYVKSESKD